MVSRRFPLSESEIKFLSMKQGSSVSQASGFAETDVVPHPRTGIEENNLVAALLISYEFTRNLSTLRVPHKYRQRKESCEWAQIAAHDLSQAAPSAALSQSTTVASRLMVHLLDWILKECKPIAVTGRRPKCKQLHCAVRASRHVLISCLL